MSPSKEIKLSCDNCFAEWPTIIPRAEPNDESFLSTVLIGILKKLVLLISHLHKDNSCVFYIGMYYYGQWCKIRTGRKRFRCLEAMIFNILIQKKNNSMITSFPDHANTNTHPLNR